MDIGQLWVGKGQQGYLKENLTELHIIVRTTGSNNIFPCNFFQGFANFLPIFVTALTSKLKGPTSYYAGLSAHHLAGRSDVFTKLLLSPSASAASCLFGYQSQNVFPDQARPVSIMRGAERRVILGKQQ